MGLSCKKQVGKIKGNMRKMENDLMRAKQAIKKRESKK